MLCLAGGLTACGVSSETYTRTLHERDQFRERFTQAELDAAAQRRQVGELQAALTEQRQTARDLQTRVTELEALTADQNLSQEALTQQLRSVTTEREELLLKLDELKSQTVPPSSASSAAPSGTTLPSGGESGKEKASAQRVMIALQGEIEAGHVSIHRLSNGLLLRLTESFLFVPGKEALTAEGQRVVSTVATVSSSIRPRRLQVRIGLAGSGVDGTAEQARAVQLAAFNRGNAVVRQLGQSGYREPELVFVAVERQGDSSPPPASEIPEMSPGEIQLMMTWPTAP